jgi:hypothetical protein
MKENYFLIFCLLITFLVHAQERERVLINGKIIVKSAPVEGVHVLNLVTEKASVSNALGEFQLAVNEDDLLVFSAVNLNYWRKSIRESDIKNGYFEVEMTSKEEKLDEVIVTEYTKINAQNLRIIDYKPRVYTPAERKLRATQIKTIDLINFNSVLIPLDPLLYWVTGRTKLLKGELAIEKKELLLKKLDNWNEIVFYLHELKIPIENVDGFKFFIIYDEELMGFLASDNKIHGNFRIATLANEFLTYLNSDE